MKRENFAPNLNILNVGRLLLAVGGLFALAPVHAACVPDSGATTVLIDATNGCDNVVGQVGCTVDFNKGQDSCSFMAMIDGEPKEISVSASLMNGKTFWSSSLPVDTAIISGGTKGNNCGYAYTYDASYGSGGFLKSDDVYQNTNSVSVCTDGLTEVAPPPPPVATPYRSCDDLGQLDQTIVMCGDDPEPSLVCNFQLDEENAGALLQEYCCVCGVSEEDQEVCIAGSEECDELGIEGRKSVDIDGGETFQLLHTPACWYSYATRQWTCIPKQ